MKTEYIKSGRYEFPTLWIEDFNPLSIHEYPARCGLEVGSKMLALNIGQALDLWKALTKGLVEASQRGTLDAGVKEYIQSK